MIVVLLIRMRSVGGSVVRVCRAKQGRKACLHLIYQSLHNGQHINRNAPDYSAVLWHQCMHCMQQNATAWQTLRVLGCLPRWAEAATPTEASPHTSPQRDKGRSAMNWRHGSAMLGWLRCTGMHVMSVCCRECVANGSYRALTTARPEPADHKEHGQRN